MKYLKDQVLPYWLAVLVLILCAQSTSQQNNQTNLSTTSQPSTTTAFQPIPTSSIFDKNCAGGKDVWNICWLNTPPYVFTEGDSGNSTKVVGILIEALEEGFAKCKCKTTFNFKRAKDYDEFLNCSKSKEVDIVLPFPEQKAALSKWLYTVVDSPNIYLLLNREIIESEAKNRVLSEFLSVWTIAVLTVLLAIIFGIIVWFLDMSWNTEQFPPTFVPGSLEGVWWSFVTLTTVGYGDKTPKFPLARVLAVVWMFIGMGMISMLTATMTKALTTAVFDYQTYIQAKNTIGVLNHSYTYDEAVKKGLQPYVFSNLDEMYKKLDDVNDDEIGGILVDIFVATYVKNNPKRYRLKNTLFVAKSYDVGYPLTFYLSPGVTNTFPLIEPPNHFTFCFASTFLTTNKHINVYAIVDKYIQRTASSNARDRENEIKFEINLFKSTERTFFMGVEILCGVLGVIILLGILWQIFYYRRYKSKSFIKNKKGTSDIESINMSGYKYRDTHDIKVMIEKLDDVDQALQTLSTFRAMIEQYKQNSRRFDSGIVNGTSHHSSSTNQGFTVTS